jgi:hypothetical protein
MKSVNDYGWHRADIGKYVICYWRQQSFHEYIQLYIMKEAVSMIFGSAPSGSNIVAYISQEEYAKTKWSWLCVGCGAGSLNIG